MKIHTLYSRFLIVLVLASVLLSACQAGQATPSTPGPGPTQNVPTLPMAATPTPTTAPPRALTVCVGQEPQTLYRYGSSTRSMWSVLEAIYDGPIDTRNYAPQPVILTKLPTLADGDAVYQPVTVKAGDAVVDLNGDLVTLEQGTVVLPSGCTSGDCAATYDGQSELQMDQLSVRFSLKPGITWSDGAPLTAADSVYAFNLSADPDTPVSKRMVDRTVDYKAVDEQTVQWTGKPGYRTSQYSGLFWSPLPEHAWSKTSAKDLLTAEMSTKKPLGWGPYVIEDWVAGDHITMTKNPAYFRAAEGLPKFERLVFRFLGEQSDSNLNALLSGECDIVDQTTLLEEQLVRVQELVGRGLIQAVVGQGPEWEHLDFGIRLAAYDAGYNMYGDYRPDIFSDVRVRQAFAYCADRAGLVKTLFSGYGQVAEGFLPPNHPDAAPNLAQYPYDPAKGEQLLMEAGWVDADNDPLSARTAAGIPTVKDGTPLSVEYLTTDATQRQAAAQYLATSMAACGIAVKPVAVSSGDLYASGPDGALFGRKFDLAQFAWQASSASPCFLYETSQIPNAKNNWLGVNVTGYSNPEFDKACQAVQFGDPEQAADYRARQETVQKLFMDELPVIPLYYHIKVAAARTDLCGLDMDPSARSELWNLESLNYGEGCKP